MATDANINTNESIYYIGVGRYYDVYVQKGESHALIRSFTTMYEARKLLELLNK